VILEKKERKIVVNREKIIAKGKKVKRKKQRTATNEGIKRL